VTAVPAGGKSHQRATARLLVATGNQGKVRELAAILAGLPVELVSLRDLEGALGPPPEVEETGTTYLANARIKAHAYAAWSGLAAVADDSGLDVDALGGAPGVRSARYAGPGADDANNLAKLLDQLDGVPPERRTARFRCAAVLALPGAEAGRPAAASRTGAAPDSGNDRAGNDHAEAISGEGGAAAPAPGGAAAGPEWHVEAAWEGRILTEPRGSGGFGYDPVFLPNGWDQTSAEVDAATKNTASHRAKAFTALRPAIEAWARRGGAA
jgi:XTP/dITP diphosphohydrolase